MKKIYFFLFMLACAFSSCDNEDGVVPFDVTNLTVEAKEGAVLLKWDVPEGIEFDYIEIEYTNPRTGQRCMQTASSYTREKEIGDLLKKDGEYTFNVHTVLGHVKSNAGLTVSCTCLPAQPVITMTSRKVVLTEDYVSTNAQEISEGPIKNLVDGDFTNFFHTSWSKPIPMPHYVDIKLEEGMEMTDFYIVTTCRPKKPDGAPKKFDIMGSQDGQSWTTLFSEEEAVHADGKPYTSPIVTSEVPVKYIRYNVRARFNNDKTDYFNLAELELYSVKRDVYDPENE